MTIEKIGQPRFPIRITWTRDGDVDEFSDEQDLLRSLEDFDSTDPEFGDVVAVDAQGRPVFLQVKIWEDLCEVRLVGSEASPKAGHEGD